MKRALLVLLLVAACGGSSSATSSGSGKAAYIAKAEAICSRANSDLAAAKKALPASTAAVPPYVHKLIDIARKDVTGLSALTPPKADAADISSKVLAPLTAQLADGDAYATQVDAAAAAKDNAKLTDLVLHPPTKTRADLAFMKTYGFAACVKAADTGNTTG